jgi:hypothetical protein
MNPDLYQLVNTAVKSTARRSTLGEKWTDERERESTGNACSTLTEFAEIWPVFFVDLPLELLQKHPLPALSVARRVHVMGSARPTAFSISVSGQALHAEARRGRA